MKKHGLPGIGITAEKGKKGKDGQGFYFGPLDYFFTYIGDNILPDSSIDYEDIDYDITYAQNEKRLNPKYKVGDILYITDTVDDGGETKHPIMYMVEITEDLTTCTQEHLLKHITEYGPFTLKSSLDEHTYLYPITIADISNYMYFTDSDGTPLESVLNFDNNLHNINNFIYNSLLSINYYDSSVVDIERCLLIDDISVIMDQSTYNYIPYKYFSDDYHRQSVVNDGKDIWKHTFPNIDISINFLSMTAHANTYGVSDINQLLFYTQRDKAMFISTQNSAKLFFDNLYIKKDNIGNADSYYTLYDDKIAMDNNGNCYTLTNNDFNSSIQGFVITPKKFLNQDNLDIKDFNYGYVHTYWNYNEDSIDTSTQKNTYYKPNYIRGSYLTDEKKNFYVYKTDDYGNYIRNWDDDKFSKVEIDEIRQLLINTPENKTLFDVSDMIPSSVDQTEKEEYFDVSGIIKIENINDYVKYSKIQCIDVSVEYRDYGNTHLYVVSLDGDTTRLCEYHDELIISNPSLFVSYIEQIVIDPETGDPIIDPETGDPQTEVIEEQSIVEDISVIINPSRELIEKYIDVSYFSGIDMYTNPSINMIKLDKLDPNGLYYRHHEIIQWIADPEGLKYYSKKTSATYDLYSNSYIIEGNWENTNNMTEFQKTADNFPEPVFGIKINNNKVYIDASNNGNQPYIIKLADIILENSNEQNKIAIESDDVTRKYVYDSSIQINSSTFSEIIGTDDDLNLLNNIFTHKDDNFNINDEYAIYEIPYYICDASNREYEKKYITQIHFNDYKDYRTLPIFKLNSYNDIKRIESVNNIENGVLCNQFLYVVDINLSDFGYENWGQMSEYIKDPVLDVSVQIDFKIQTPDSSLVSDSISKITYAVLNPNIDIYHTSVKTIQTDPSALYTQILSIPQNILQESLVEDSVALQLKFNLDSMYKGTLRAYMLIETSNPEPLYIYLHTYISALSITAVNNNENIVYNLNQEYLFNKEQNYYLYNSKPLKAVFAPISYIAGYKQEMDDMFFVNNKLQGEDEQINIAIKPYRLNEIEQLYTQFNDRSEDSTLVNWSTLKFKKRFLQDNIKTLSITPLNINYIKDVIPQYLYCYYKDDEYISPYLADDQDDIYDTYLEIVYNADLYNSLLIEDKEQFIYNGDFYLSSKYSQFTNNTAIYIKQESEYNVRSYKLLNSMQKWNSIYPTYKYPSDNPYPGHIELYGNGYQYLAKTVDKGQYLQEGYMSLSDIKDLNNSYFFNTDDFDAYITNINKPEKINAYMPDILFRSLLYQMEWVYPRYYTDPNVKLNLIKRFILSNADEQVSENTMPYNLTYTIYPRALYNDEEQANIILMLRRPSIVKENQYKLGTNDVYIPGVEELQDLVNPINVMD